MNRKSLNRENVTSSNRKLASASTYHRFTIHDSRFTNYDSRITNQTNRQTARPASGPDSVGVANIYNKSNPSGRWFVTCFVDAIESAGLLPPADAIEALQP